METRAALLVCEELTSSGRQVFESGGFSVEVLDSFMSGCDWEAAVDGYIQRHCWLFAEFDPEREIDLQLHESWLCFERTVEALLSRQLQSSLGCCAEQCEAALEQRILNNGALDEGVTRLLQKVESIGTFQEFGHTMRAAQQKQSLARSFEQTNAVVRVLWDIENMPVPHGVAAADMADAILCMLESQGWHGALVTVFHCPYKAAGLTARHADELDKAGFEQVLCGRKGEAADRALSRRIRDTIRLPIEHSKLLFVLISSDQDYVAELLELHQLGIAVHVIHSAPAGSTHEHTLARYATSVLSWQDRVLSQLAPPAAARGVQQRVPAAAVEGRCAAWIIERESGTGARRITKNFGFLESDAVKGRVFAHNTVLEGTGKFRQLHRNEKVWFTFEKGKKGFVAKRVGLVKL